MSTTATTPMAIETHDRRVIEMHPAVAAALDSGADLIMVSRPVCVQCKSTERAAEKKGLTITKVNAEDYPDMGEWVGNLTGVMAVPLVLNAHSPISEHWTGFRPDMLDYVAEQIKNTAA